MQGTVSMLFIWLLPLHFYFYISKVSFSYRGIDKEYVGRRDILISNNRSYIFIYLTVVYVVRSWFFSYVGAESHTSTFFSLSRSGQATMPTLTFNTLFLFHRLYVFLSRWLTPCRGCTCWIWHTHSDCSRFSSLVFLFSLAFCILHILVAIRSCEWNISFPYSFAKILNFQKVQSVLATLNICRK